MLSILVEIETFYVLDALKHRTSRTKDDKPFLKSHERLRKDVVNARERQENLLFEAMRDYLSGICFGEARHSGNACSHELLVEHGEYDLPTYRDSAIDSSEQYEPMKFLPVLAELFEIYSWEAGYGGNSWARLCEIAYKAWTGEWEKTTLIDHVTDLRHNNGLAFNKNVIFEIPGGLDESRLNEFLNEKRNKSLEQWRGLILPPSVWRLLWRAKQLGFISCLPISVPPKGVADISFERKADHVETIQEEGYEPWDWGGVEWSYTLVERQVLRCTACHHEIDEYYVKWNEYGDPYCEACYHELFGVCDECGEEHLSSDLTTLKVAEAERMTYCEVCMDDIRVVECVNCGEPNLRADSLAAEKVAGNWYCYRCAPEMKAQHEQGFTFLHYNSLLGYDKYIKQGRLFISWGAFRIDWEPITTISSDLCGGGTNMTYSEIARESDEYDDIMAQQEYNRVKKKLHRDIAKLEKEHNVNKEDILREQLIKFIEFADGTPDDEHVQSWWSGPFPGYPREVELDYLKEHYSDVFIDYLIDLSHQAKIGRIWAQTYCARFNELRVSDLLAYLEIEDDVPAYFDNLRATGLTEEEIA